MNQSVTNFPIRTTHLIKRFRSVEALRGLDLEVPPHSIYALVGPNGAGKTTSIKILMNILKPTSGRAEVLGMDSRALSGTGFCPIGYVSENQEMPEWMRIQHLLEYVRPFYPNWDRQLEAELVRKLDLPLDKKVKTLSRGARMKVALASSLAFHPQLLVLDEPFSGLDPLVRQELAEALQEHAKEATVFISSHDLAEIEGFATHLGYLESGRLLFSEQLELLTGRFREIDLQAPTAVASSGHWPETWMQVQRFEGRVTFIESQFEPERTLRDIRTRFGEVGEVRYQKMSLKSIFVAIAKSGKSRDAQVLV